MAQHWYCMYVQCMYLLFNIDTICMYVCMHACMYIHKYICMYVKYWSCARHPHDCRQSNHITDNSNKMTIHMTIRSKNSIQYFAWCEMTIPSHLIKAYLLNAIMLETHVTIFSHQQHHSCWRPCMTTCRQGLNCNKTKYDYFE
jgi:hypothetical protein